MNNRKPIFFTSDLHIGHANIIKFSNRPFTDIQHMHRVLKNNYNAIVPKNGICYFLGDVGMCSEEMLGGFLKDLNGTKILMIGNHDKNVNAMYSLGFDAVMNNATMIIAGEVVSMSHCPLLGVYRENTDGMRNALPTENWYGESRSKMKAFSMKDNGQFHLHGHIHSPNGGKSTRIEDKQFDVGVDANNYRPVSITEIESFISKYKQRINNDKSK